LQRYPFIFLRERLSCIMRQTTRKILHHFSFMHKASPCILLYFPYPPKGCSGSSALFCAASLFFSCIRRCCHSKGLCRKEKPLHGKLPGPEDFHAGKSFPEYVCAGGAYVCAGGSLMQEKKSDAKSSGKAFHTPRRDARADAGAFLLLQ
jgi:hypothetical protein